MVKEGLNDLLKAKPNGASQTTLLLYLRVGEAGYRWIPVAEIFILIEKKCATLLWQLLLLYQ